MLGRDNRENDMLGGGILGVSCNIIEKTHRDRSRCFSNSKSRKSQAGANGGRNCFFENLAT